MENKNLPTVIEIFEKNELAEVRELHENLNYYLSQEPPKTWIKAHPYIQNYSYLPIDKVELMLRKVFKYYRIEITGQGVAFNGVWVTVRVHYFNPASKQMEFHDGIGAEQLQTKSGSSPAQLENINHGAISMAFPKAKTAAVKDACDHFGTLFGANINRKDTINFTPDTKPGAEAEQPKIAQEIQDSLDLTTDEASLDKYLWQITSADKKLNSNMAFRSAVEKCRQRLKPKTS